LIESKSNYRYSKPATQYAWKEVTVELGGVTGYFVILTYCLRI